MGSVEIPEWLKELPLAPEFRPTDTEFADPIAYISKIEKESRAFGICKVIPPFPRPSKRYVFNNLNKSLSKSPELGENANLLNINGDEARAVFTTRQQELGQCARKLKGETSQMNAHKQVWQSGQVYTLDQFESKSKIFAKSVLGMLKEVNPMVIEALFWKAASEKAIYVEYANDVPGSGFSEPEDQYSGFRSRRRKRDSYQSYRRGGRENLSALRLETKDVNSVPHLDMKLEQMRNDLHEDVEVREMQSLNDSSVSQDELTKPSKRKNIAAGNDMEGSAGWKLSNSPWNLQVIARSPGSLTRYMPDDIPGVTSPMVYIGMLFSWFAWHVEDHELHSLNFLHTGSPKTWYAVPGEYSHTFEDVIRSKAYGGNIDRIAALSLLGEKTTLLSPEMVVQSNIPCCRLVQHPGEFVITFPSAYHVGFSHGFNCGEAANFGTPLWLDVAKDAAIRRASMNYLPMLSHQQLMYLLTMSFVSRIPRSLLPGVRCSRLRDRQREDRELSVKKAFIKDLLDENDILSALLGKSSSYRAVLWNADWLPGVRTETQSSAAFDTDANITIQTSSPTANDGKKSDLVEEMTIYMENLNSLHEEDYMLSEFQIDSGTLACVACGILGYPFMCVIQPSNEASVMHSSSNKNAEEDLVSNVENSDDSRKKISLPPGWISCKFSRPRLFCLEHGTQVEHLLRSQGGANVLVICHSDFQKIKANAAVIAVEICNPYDFRDVPIDTASQEELNAIDLAIDGDDHADCGEDWTSALNINLQFCVRMKKQFPSKQFQHALPLGGFLCEKDDASPPSMNWRFRRSRSKIKSDHCSLSQSLEHHDSSRVSAVEEQKFIQYSRRKRKEKVTIANACDRGCSSFEQADMLVDNTISASSAAGSSQEQTDKSRPMDSAIMVSDAIQEGIVLPAGDFHDEAEKCIEGNREEKLSSVCASSVNESDHLDVSFPVSKNEDDLCSQTSTSEAEEACSSDSEKPHEKGQSNASRLSSDTFIRGPCEGLRPRASKSGKSGDLGAAEPLLRRQRNPKRRRGSHQCDIDGCSMSFDTKTKLLLHKRNRCPHDGCSKRFSSHKYAMVHQRVHEDERPLRCPWKGCCMTFKWAWARTEHVRVHTGEKPYQCKVEGCGRSFRFVSDFSRHRRRTGHRFESHGSFSVS